MSAATLLDKIIDENNNWFSNIDIQSTIMDNLPESTFSFKGSVMQCIDQNLGNLDDESENDHNCKLNKQKQQLTKQSVKRALFVEKDEIDHEANLKLVRNQLEQLEKEDSEKWNFDFKNNRPINNVNSQYEWFIGEPVLSKVDLNRNDNCDCDKKWDKNLKINSIKQSNSNSTSSNINTRSLKRRLNIIDYFQPTKKRALNCLKKDQNSNDNLLLVNKSLKYNQNEITTSSSRSIRLQQSTNVQQSVKQELMRKCKKSIKPVSKTQQRRQKKSKSLEKVCKRQTTLKF